MIAPACFKNVNRVVVSAFECFVVGMLRVLVDCVMRTAHIWLCICHVMFMRIAQSVGSSCAASALRRLRNLRLVRNGRATQQEVS
jgi:hypothetical protein